MVSVLFSNGEVINLLALVPTEHWSIPSWIDEEKARLAREEMEKNNVIYGGSLPYRHMCRFQSGFFFREPVLDPYEWYWRVVLAPSFRETSIDNRNPGRIIIVILNMMCSSTWN
jgi:Glycolipid 2-alpha-mannosyltransferase